MESRIPCGKEGEAVGGGGEGGTGREGGVVGGFYPSESFQ